MLQFSWLEELLLGKSFWVVNTWRSSVRKWLKGSTLTFADTFLTDAAQNHARVSPNNELFIFYCNNSTSFESVFCMKTVKSRLFKKIFGKKKIAGTVLLLSWLASYQWKKIYWKLQFCWCRSSECRKSS